MKYLALAGLSIVALALASAHLLEAVPMAHLTDTTQVGLFGIGLLALGAARRGQAKG